MPTAAVKAEELVAPERRVILTCSAIYAMLLILPFCFGGASPTAALGSQAVIFALLAAWLTTASGRVKAAFGCSTLARQILWCLVIFSLFSAVQLTLFALRSAGHPVFERVSSLPAPSMAVSAFRDLLCFTAFFLLVFVALCTVKKFPRGLCAILLLSGLLVSLAALAHWFYDNGRLFWIFEPENVFVSDRARWPFVNANHLAQFLLPVLFLGAAVFTNQVIEFAAFSALPQPKHRRKLAGLLSRSFQAKVLSLTLSAVALIAMLLAIMASLSRGSWFGLTIGLLVFILGFPRRASLPSSEVVQALYEVPAGEPHRSRRRSRCRKESETPTIFGKSWLGLLRASIRPAVALLALFMLYFFLSGKGSELVENRLEYGLLYSKDDMRWALFRDTLGMIREHIFLGVGLGQWSQHYPLYMNQMLAGINPVYLHSDPLQLLAEVGLLGLLPMAACIVLVLKGARRAFRTTPQRHIVLLIGVISGLSALLAASCFDFPFRIPAISTSIAAYLAIIAFYSTPRAAQPQEDATYDVHNSI